MELSGLTKTVKALLPERLIKYDGCGIGKIEGPCALQHRDTYTSIGMLYQYLFWYAPGLISQHDEAVLLIANLGINMPCLRSGIVYLCSGIFLKEIPVVYILKKLHIVPVVHAGTPYLLFIDAKAIGPYEMKLRAGSYAGPADISGIKGYARFMKDYLQRCSILRKNGKSYL